MSEICSNSRLGAPPADFEIQPEIPARHGGDGHGVGEVAVHSQQIELQIEQNRIEYRTGEANQLEFAQAPQPRLRTGLLRRDITKGPEIIPPEIIENRHF